MRHVHSNLDTGSKNFPGCRRVIDWVPGYFGRKQPPLAGNPGRPFDEEVSIMIAGLNENAYR